jgi:hypothetical protein
LRSLAWSHGLACGAITLIRTKEQNERFHAFAFRSTGWRGNRRNQRPAADRMCKRVFIIGIVN